MDYFYVKFVVLGFSAKTTIVHVAPEYFPDIVYALFLEVFV